jgi:uncharacterized protein (TIGR02118 family)
VQTLENAMIKSLSLLIRKPDMTREQFREVWENEHAPMVRSVPEVRKYVLSFVLDQPKTSNAPVPVLDVDAVAELWFDDVESMQRANARPEMQAVRANGSKYLGAIKPLITEEVEVI